MQLSEILIAKINSTQKLRYICYMTEGGAKENLANLKHSCTFLHAKVYIRLCWLIPVNKRIY